MSRLSMLAGLFGAGLMVCMAESAPAQQFLGRSAAEWQKDLRHNDPVIRRGAAFALGRMNIHALSALPELTRLLKEDKASSVREATASALGEIGRDALGGAVGSLVPALATALAEDPDPLVKRSAAVALGQFGSDVGGSGAALEKALSDAAPEVRQNAAWALGKLKITSAVPGLRKVLTNGDAAGCRDAANALSAMGEAARPALPELLAGCKNPDAEVKKSVLGVLVRLLGPEDEKIAGPALRTALIDPEVEVRRNAAFALGNIGGDDAAAAVPVLVDALFAGDLDVRRQAAAAIKNIGPAAKAAVKALNKALSDPDQQLRRNAAVALGGLAKEAEPAVPALVRLLADEKEDVGVRVESAVALSRIGPVKTAEDAVPSLVTVLENSKGDSSVRERTLWALRVHWKQMENLPGVFPALGKILTEPKQQQSRMLRYDAAYILGGLQGPKCPPATLNVLLEFLQDKTILIYSGTKTVVTGTGEKDTGSADVKESGKGDGRVMAILALRRIGPDRVREHPAIIAQLRDIANDGSAFADLRAKAKEALTELAP